MVISLTKFCNELESIKYNVALAITGAIGATSKIKLNKELGLECLKCNWTMGSSVNVLTDLIIFCYQTVE